MKLLYIFILCTSSVTGYADTNSLAENDTTPGRIDASQEKTPEVLPGLIIGVNREEKFIHLRVDDDSEPYDILLYMTDTRYAGKLKSFNDLMPGQKVSAQAYVLHRQLEDGSYVRYAYALTISSNE